MVGDFCLKRLECQEGRVALEMGGEGEGVANIFL